LFGIARILTPTFFKIEAGEKMRQTAFHATPRPRLSPKARAFSLVGGKIFPARRKIFLTGEMVFLSGGKIFLARRKKK